jgi:SAM-dependent methyltransferase
VPAPITPARAASALSLRYRVLANRGDAVACPVCGHRFARFRDDWNRENALCWRCGAHERHRTLWLYLERHPELLGSGLSLLHFAPEWCLERRFRQLRGIRYVTGDLRPAEAELELDITRLALPDGAFDAIICSHVLEHVEDDAAAMRELYRVLAAGGWAIVMVPLDLGRSETLEDPAVRSERDRELWFGQSDHVRVYAPDIAGRLEAAGFAVTRERVALTLGAEAVARYRLLEADDLFMCRKPAV